MAVIASSGLLEAYQTHYNKTRRCVNMHNLTVRDIADMLKVSKTTVQKAIKAADINYDYVERNRQYYNLDKARAIILSIRNDFDFSSFENQFANSATESATSTTNIENQTENLKIQLENHQPKTENSTTNDEMAALHRLIDLVQQQLAEKDKQLAAKDKQIQDLSDRLAEAMQLTHGQQYIAAADKVAQLQSKVEDNPVPDVVVSASPISDETRINEVQTKKSFLKII